MLIRSFAGASLLLISGGLIVPAQTSFQGLTPGVNTYADAIRVLGQPQNGSFAPPPGIAAVWMDYGIVSKPPDEIIDVINVKLLKPVSREGLIQKLKLPAKPNPLSGGSPNQKMTECFGWQALVCAYYAGPDQASGIQQLAYFSRRYAPSLNGLFPGEDSDFLVAPVPRQGEINGVITLNGVPVKGASVDFYQRSELFGWSMNGRHKTNGHGVFVRAGSFDSPYVLVIWGPGMKWMYLKDVRTPLSAPLKIVARPGDGKQPSDTEVMAQIK